MLRRTATVVAGLVGLCVATVLLVGVEAVEFHRRDPTGGFEIFVVVGLAFGVIYAGAVRPAVIISPSTVVVIQPFGRREVAVSDIERVTGAGGLSIHLVDGSNIKVWAFSASKIARLLGDRRAREVQSQIQDARVRAQGHELPPPD
jgi:hypothetical protein